MYPFAALVWEPVTYAYSYTVAASSTNQNHPFQGNYFVFCSNHPDLRGSEAAARFVKIQEAYEVVTGKRRGATGESAPQSSSAASGWDFHDWSAADFLFNR